MGLEKGVWIADIKENPIPDHSFINASTDMSAFVDNNTLHLAEAGIDPKVHENFFQGNAEGLLPITSIEDTPSEVVLKIYSTEATRHRNLEEVELQYDKRGSIVKRHRDALIKNIGKVAAFQWTTDRNDTFNKHMNLASDGSIIDAIIDLKTFYDKLDITGTRNLCLAPDHMARIKKEDKQLYKDLTAKKGQNYQSFNIYEFSQTPLFAADGTKKPFGIIEEATDRRSSFAWVTDEVFRCFGDVKMFEEMAKAQLQADLISFAQRALVGNIRAASPKYLASFI